MRAARRSNAPPAPARRVPEPASRPDRRRVAAAARELVRALEPLRFGAPVAHVYHPLVYAREPYDAYLDALRPRPKEVVLVRHESRPFGMAQTGVPFGEVALVRDWLGIEGRSAARRASTRSARSSASRARAARSPARGSGASRATASGRRSASSRASSSRTTARCSSSRRAAATARPTSCRSASARRSIEACDAHLRRPSRRCAALVVGVGAFAEGARATRSARPGLAIGRIPHPSPASPGRRIATGRGRRARLRRSRAVQRRRVRPA